LEIVVKSLPLKLFAAIREAKGARLAAKDVDAEMVGMHCLHWHRRRVRLGQLHVYTPTTERLR